MGTQLVSPLNHDVRVWTAARQGQNTHVDIEPEHSACFFIFAVNHLVGATKFQYSQLNLTTQQPVRSPSRVEKVVGRSPSGRTTWLTGGRGRHQTILWTHTTSRGNGRFSPMFTGTSKKKKKFDFSSLLQLLQQGGLNGVPEGGTKTERVPFVTSQRAESSEHNLWASKVGKIFHICTKKLYVRIKPHSI